MKKGFLLGTLGLAALLAACGGGGGSGNVGPGPIPATQPPTQYTAKLVFTGPLAGNQIQSDLRRAESATMDASSTPPPVMIVSPITTAQGGCLAGDCVVAPGSPQGYVQALVSPEPTSSPTVAFSQTASHVEILATPTPSASETPAPMPTGVIAEAGVGNDGGTNVQSSGTATANIGGPVNLQPTTQVYQYLAIAAVCNYPNSGGAYGAGWAWNGTSWTPVSDPSQADIYVTGSICTGAYATPGDNGTLHFPGGGVLLSTDTPFSSVSASQWTNTEASVTAAALGVANGDGSYNSMLVAKTHDGKYTFKVFPNMVSGGNGDMTYAGAVEVSGAGVDGF